MRTIRLLMTVLGLLAALAVTGCSAEGDDGGGDSLDAGAGVPDEQAAEAEDNAGPASGDQPSDGDTGGEAAGVLIDNRSIIYTGAITVRAPDVAGAAQQVTALADRYGGFVGGDRRSADGEHASATMLLRIPSENFTVAVDALAELGAEQSREIGTEDVTEEVVDLQARVATARASVERTRELLDRAESISDIVAIEEELAEREARLASLEGRQRRLADLVTLSTITVTLISEDAPVETGATRTGFLAGLRAGWDAFTTSMGVLVTVLGALLPWLVAVGVPAGGLVWWSRRRRAGRPVEAGPPPGASA
jgi:hypothetical protein